MDTGSFGAAAGGISPELQAAMQRRGQGGATAAVTQGAPGFDPLVQPAQAPTGAPPMPMGAVPAQPSAQAPTPALPFDSSEAQLIIKSLDSRLKALSKVDELKANPLAGLGV